MLVAKNPCNETLGGGYPALKGEQIHQSILNANNAFRDWKSIGYIDRAGVLRAVAVELRNQKQALAELMAIEMGKPVKEGAAEVEKAAGCCEFYAEHGAGFLKNETLQSDASNSYLCFPPLGTLLGILPWNAPLWLAFRYLAPALMAGNTCVLKHDPNVPGCGAAIVKLFDAVGAPANIVVNLPVVTADVEGAIRDPLISAISFTGSAVAGSKVASMAASEIKPAVLELGGSDPSIVMAGADLETAANAISLSRTINAGQSCIAAKRILVEDAIYDQFVEMLKTRLAKLRMGDPLDADTDIGPIARQDLQLNLDRQVQETLAAGAHCLLGGTLPEGPGYFYPPTLLTEVTPSMCAFREETFGPVMVVTRVKDLDEAVLLANDTEYGLAASIWMADVKLAEQTAMRIDAGQVVINGIVKTDSRLPSGGVKRSGYGRELGPQGIREFVNTKQIWIK
ncbi:MAG: succinate-semialdehyde dehydrogenase/glutarate-semialdehyde dehydrogenase [Motiliproteus sp.]|jgi:succinate-semialdehyde dehydrogenase/glutarate-semialdehyde dehydrogenase